MGSCLDCGSELRAGQSFVFVTGGRVCLDCSAKRPEDPPWSVGPIEEKVKVEETPKPRLAPKKKKG